MSGPSANLLSTLRGTRLVILAFLTVALLVAFGRALTGAYVEILWQSQAGYISAFWTRVLWEWGVRLVAGVAVGILVFVNLKVAATTLGGIQIRRRFGNLEISEQIPKHYVTWGMVFAAVLLGVWFGASLPSNLGRTILLLINAEPWGLVDPIHGLDVSFYVFSVPVLGLSLVYTLTTTFLVFTLATAGYAATGAVTWSRGRLTAHPAAQKHLGVILGVFFLLLAGRFSLGRYVLLRAGGSAVQGIFGYADAAARLPAMQTLTVISVVAAAAVVWGAWKNRPTVVIAACASVVLGTGLIGELYPSLVQRFKVQPNELAEETPFIEHNLEYTRIGFGLAPDVLDRRSFAYSETAPVDWTEAARQFSGLPVWNRGPLLTTYAELEALFPYYNFSAVTIDRYVGPEGPVPVALSVREINPGGIQDPNWQNVHLRERYVAGMGAVASLASTRSPQGRPEMLITGIPPKSSPRATPLRGLDLTRPQIFFGTQIQQRYAVVNPGPDQYLAPDSTLGVAGIDFPPGIQLTSGIRTALLAWRFRSVDLLFASEVTEESRFIFRRRVVERAVAVAPFLSFPEAPYPIVAGGRVVWMMEGFTTTAAFPLSTVNAFGTFRSRVTYVRNSFKVTIDAVSGRIDLYRVPIEDPLADTYARAYPDLFKPISEMPPEIREHIRYSQAFLDLQGRVLRQYHQETAPEFHGQQDVWDEPQELSQNTNRIPYRAEYGLYRLPGEEEARFQLTTVFVPTTRQNLTAVLVARTDAFGVPELILIDLSVDDGILGPRQIESLVEQDPVISQQFSLWRTGGSQVWTGHLHVVPVGNRFLYMEPVFLAAEQDAIPELRRFVVSDGVRVEMTESLADAIAQLAGFDAPTAVTEVADVALLPETTSAWPAAALDLLEDADARARAGDWQGYGEALERLRALLSRLEAGGG